MKGAYRYSLTFLAFLCLSKEGECQQCSAVRASRSSRFVPEGGRLQLSCEVLHCGESGWTGGWVFQEINSTEFVPLTPSGRINLSNRSSTASNTHLLVDIHNVNQSDAGAYKCLINWHNQVTSAGHVTYVNVTAGDISSGRSSSHRVLLLLAAFMSSLGILGVFWCVCRDKPSPPPPVPPHPRSSFAARVKEKKELVYAEVALNDSRIQTDHQKQASEQTVYSTVRF